MSHVQHHVEQLVIPVAGAANMGQGRLSTAAGHLLPLRRQLESDGDRVVAYPVVPYGLGLLHSLDKTYRHYLEEVDRLTECYPNAELVLVGHSLGGLLARKQASERLGKLRGVITIGSPHAGLNHLVPGIIRHEYGRFAQAIAPTTDAPLTLIGSAHDEVVPLQSALAPLERASRHELSVLGHIPLIHNTLPIAPAVTSLAACTVNEMFGMPALLESPGLLFETA